MSVAVKPPDISTEKSYLHFAVRRQSMLIACLLTASIAATILCHAHIYWRLSSESRTSMDSMLQVNYSSEGLCKKQTECTGSLVAGKEWYSILQNTDQVRMESYNITKQRLEAFKVVSKILCCFRQSHLCPMGLPNNTALVNRFKRCSLQALQHCAFSLRSTWFGSSYVQTLL